ncbi:MAG: hypothetical protein ACE5J7_01430 [Candidatus Aenigmatarchaeota archaeon]
MGVEVPDPEECGKCFKCKDEKLCGWPFPSEPNKCIYYDSGGEVVHVRYRSGENIMYRRCSRPNGQPDEIEGIVTYDVKQLV